MTTNEIKILKRLIERDFERCETISDFKKMIFEDIDILENKKYLKTYKEKI